MKESETRAVTSSTGNGSDAAASPSSSSAQAASVRAATRASSSSVQAKVSDMIDSNICSYHSIARRQKTRSTTPNG